VGTIQDLMSRMEELGEKHGHEAAALRHELHQVVLDTLRGMVVAAQGDITPEIRAMADYLYDHRLANVVAKALGMHLGELQKLLGKDEVRKCRACGEPFTVRLRRKVGGYQSVYSTECKRCYREQRQAAREREEIEAAQQQRQRAVVQAIEFLPWPQAVELIARELKDVIESYVQCCAICDAPKVSPWIWHDKHFDRNKERDQLVLACLSRRGFRNRGEEFPSLVLEALRHYNIRTYHERFGINGVPTLYYPLLFVCEQHAPLLEETHIKIPLEYNVQKR